MVVKRLRKYITKFSRDRLFLIKRRSLSLRYIRGSGIEIGALHSPLPVAEGVSVKYVDIFSRDENIKKYPELDGAGIVVTDCLDDGFILSTIPEASQDFVVANHVLEHTPNPIQVLKNWARVIKVGGILFITVPLSEKCFDKGRPLTTLQHLVDDFELYNRNELEEISRRNKRHLVEWVTISEPNCFREQSVDYLPLSASELKKRLDGIEVESSGIHFHCFSPGSVKRMLSFFTTKVVKRFGVEVVKVNGGEVIAVLRKRKGN